MGKLLTVNFACPSIDLSGKPQEITQPFTKVHIKTAKKKAIATPLAVAIFGNPKEAASPPSCSECSSRIGDLILSKVW
ncbi:hypothetical protein BJP34_25095 [Moorena producens PAL-8-15-08-1]|uniref:Uncharacterized protein n=1 Tax=Moorena producens PAL-8-15-08-1 TaxID=1458985 RepID=A0A1D8TXM1_9CYAN|nr:hypothetical protein BJP34_25095 [Moorena producens PAL-8-15-08-1]